MNELVLANRAADWRRLKMLVLDSVSSPINKRVYNMALNEFLDWFAFGELEQIQLLLGHPSVQTTERYLGTKQDLVHAANDAIKLKLAVCTDKKWEELSASSKTAPRCSMRIAPAGRWSSSAGSAIR